MERRPIASRNTRWADTISSWLAGTGITPNTISVLGTVFATGAGASYYLTTTGFAPAWVWWILGAFFVQCRLLANLFDGMVAQIQGTTSPLGELFNEIPDRFSDVVILVGFGAALHSDLLLGLVAAILALVVAYLRAQLAVSGVPQQYIGPMAKAHRMAVVTVASFPCAFLPQWPIAVGALWIIIAGCVITIVRRLAAGVRHLNGKNDQAP